MRLKILNELEKHLCKDWSVSRKLIRLKDINDFPHLSMMSFGESRVHIGNNIRYSWLDFDIKGYVHSDSTESIEHADRFSQDVENSLSSFSSENMEALWVMTVATDEGAHAPYGLCEFGIRILYNL